MDMTFKLVDIKDILIDDNFNCRGALVPIDVKDLAEDILKNGQHQPVVLMEHTDSEIASTGKRYKLVAGFRRTYANILNKASQVPAVIKPHMNDQDARVLNLSENLKRQDLNILQEAKALEKLYLAGVARERVAERIGKSSTWVQVRFALLQLEPDIQKEAAAGILNQYQIRKMSAMTRDQRVQVVRQIKERLERNEKTDSIIVRKSPKPHERKHRNKSEVEGMIKIIMEQMGGSVATRTLAWAAGNISDYELFQELEKFAPTVGKMFLTQVVLLTGEKALSPV